MPTGRARQAHQKLERRQDILDVAREALATTPFQAIAMAHVAERVGLAKGTLYLYFETKEALFLALLEQEIAGWFEAIDPAIGRLACPATPEAVADLLASSLEDRGVLTTLLGILHGILEQNVGAERVMAFKLALLARMEATGATLERALAGLAPGAGARLLLRASAVVVGLRQVASPGAGLAAALAADPRLAWFVNDGTRELAETLTALIRGMERRGGTDDEERIERPNRAGHGRVERPWG